MSSIHDELLIDAYEVDLHRAEVRIADLTEDVTWYRAIAKAAIHRLHSLTVERDRLRARVRELLNEHREAA